jgi:hypothetical protein
MDMEALMQEITEEEYLECVRLTRLYAPSVLPFGWEKLTASGPFKGQQWYMHATGLKVIFTADNIQGDGKTWLHVGMSRESRLPSYDDMRGVKDLFIGKLRQALQIFPRADKHVNIHPYCLHLWCAVEGDGLPDFGKGGMI